MYISYESQDQNIVTELTELNFVMQIEYIRNYQKLFFFKECSSKYYCKKLGSQLYELTL